MAFLFLILLLVNTVYNWNGHGNCQSLHRENGITVRSGHNNNWKYSLHRIRREVNVKTKYIKPNEEDAIENSITSMDQYYERSMHRHYENAPKKCTVVVGGLPPLDYNVSIIRRVEEIGHMLGFENPLDDVNVAWPISLPHNKNQIILINLLTKKIRLKWVTAFRVRKLWTEKLFLQEYVPKEIQDLVRYAKDMAKVEGWKYVWLKDGIVYLRKIERSPVYCTKSKEFLHKIFHPDTPVSPVRDKNDTTPSS
uniref:FP protein C-terminal domain-containing protein n=1 Tax=Cacopsylla melanoneura TaxID=428564 RepID=A0A8D9B338_9HEMI